MAETGYTSYADKSTGEHLLQAGKDTPLVKNVIQGVNDAANGDISALKGDVTGFASSAAGVLSDPLNALISAGLGFLMDVITPLRDELRKVTGDPEALKKGNMAFAEIGTELGRLTTELDDITKQGFQSWTGTAKDAASHKVGTFVNGVQGTVNNAENVAELLAISGALMEAAYNLVMSIIADVIEWLIVTWVAALAAEIPTLGGSTVAAGAATATEVAVGGANAAEKVRQATTLVERISAILQKIMSALKKLRDASRALNEGRKALKDGKDLKGIKDVKSAEQAAEDAKKAEADAKKAEAAGKDAKEATKEQSLADKAKDLGQKKLDGFKDKHWDQPKEDLKNLIHNPQGRLQEMAHSRDRTLGKQIEKKLIETGVDTGKKLFKSMAGNLLDPVGQARIEGPSGFTPASNETIDQELQG